MPSATALADAQSGVFASVMIGWSPLWNAGVADSSQGGQWQRFRQQPTCSRRWLTYKVGNSESPMPVADCWPIFSSMALWPLRLTRLHLTLYANVAQWRSA
jgi:hypothetical protein